MPPTFHRNPYLNRSMIRRTEQFFGREREVMRIMQRLGASPPQSVAIVGDRRVGKSSLLHYVSRPEIASGYLYDPDNTVFLFVDFQEVRGLSVDVFFETLFRHLREALEGRVTIDEAADSDGLRALLGRLDSEGIALIVLLDEFDRVTRSSSFDADFFSYLRSLAGRYNLAFVTSSGRELKELCLTEEIADSPFFNIFSSVFLGSMTESEARDMVLTPAENLPFPVADHVDLILELGGHWPFFVQSAASAVFEILLEHDEAPRELVYGRFSEEAMPHFQFYWEQMDPVSRGLCNEVANGNTPGDGSQLTELVRRGFIIGDSEPRLFSSCFAEYIRETYRMEVGDLPLEVQAERARELEGEVAKARQLQMSLLPDSMPEVDELTFAGKVVPASDVGGDFYTFVELDEGRCLGIVAVDVCGHGMEAAVVAMRLSETLRYESRDRTAPDEILTGLNKALCGTLPSGGFVGCCICVIDKATYAVDVAICGYHPPMQLHAADNSVSSPTLGSMPLGMREGTQYESIQLQLAPGDSLLIYSDGVIEASDDRDTEYGDERLEALVQAAGEEGMSPDDLIERLLWDVGRFSISGGEQADDITAIAVQRTA